MRYLRLTLFVFALSFCFTAKAQVSLSINLEKPGALAKEIRKEMKKQNLGDVSNLTSLTLEGDNYTSEDLEYLETLTQLKSLAFSKMPQCRGREGGLFEKYYNSGIWNVDCFPNIEEFTMPCNRSTFFEATSKTNLKKLICNYFPKFRVSEQVLYLNTLEITNTWRNDYNNRSEVYPWSGFRGVEDSSLQGIEVLVGTLILPSVNSMPYKGDDVEEFMGSVLPFTLFFKDKQLAVLNYYHPNVVSNEIIANVDYLSPHTFLGSGMREITLPSNITQIPAYCFENCDSLQTVNMEGIKRINGYAFKNSAVTQLSLPASVKELDAKAFVESNIQTVYLNGPAPKWGSFYGTPNYSVDANDVTLYTNALFIVPQEYEQSYQTGIWAEIKPLVKEKAKPYTFTAKKVGDFSAFVDGLGEEASGVMQLTVKGILDDFDIKRLSRFPNLTSIDLSDCLIVKSEYTAYQEYLYDQAVKGIAKQKLQQMQGANQMEHDKGWRSSQSYLENKALMDAAMRELKKSEYKYEKPNNNCYLPKKVFDLNQHLDEVVLPKSLTYVSEPFENVRTVILPQNLKRIEEKAFRGCKLKSLIVPSSLEYIGPHCFNNYGMIEELDLSNTRIESLPRTAFSSGIKVLKAPKGLKSITSGNPSASRSALGGGSIVWDVETVYYYTIEPPEGVEDNIGYNQTIHIPKGSKNAWLNKVSSQLNRKESRLVDDL